MRSILIWGTALAVLCAAASSADPRAEAVVKKAREKGKSLRTLTATIEYRSTGGFAPSLTGEVRLVKPNAGRLTLSSGGLKQEIYSDGKTIWFVQPSEKEYTSQETGGGPSPLEGMPQSPIAAFLRPESIGADGKLAYGGKKRVGAKSYDLVRVEGAKTPGPTTLYISPEGLVEGFEVDLSSGDEKMTVSMWLKGVKLNTPMTAASFAFRPPAGFQRARGPEDSLLAVGATAPDFLLPQPAGAGNLSLEQALKDKKAVLINFWFYS